MAGWTMTRRAARRLRCGASQRYMLPRGRLAQLVERLLYTQKVGGSNPSPPTSLRSSSFGSARANKQQNAEDGNFRLPHLSPFTVVEKSDRFFEFL
jgi:hypothetical protein